MKYDIKFTRLQEEAKQDNPYAQYELAKHHIEQREYAEAIYWLQKAAKQGFMLASNKLEDVIQNGLRRK